MDLNNIYDAQMDINVQSYWAFNKTVTVFT